MLPLPSAARFRYKKKQREAALEQDAKVLRDRVSDLEADNAKLKTEIGWLRSLVTQQGGSFAALAEGSPLPPAPVPTANGTAHAAAAPSHPSTAVASNPPPALPADRLSGLHPRGVGTPHAQQHHAPTNGPPQTNGFEAPPPVPASLSKPPVPVGSKRDRED